MQCNIASRNAILLEEKVAYSVFPLPYTQNFLRYVNFMDLAGSRAAVKIYTMKILLSHII